MVSQTSNPESASVAAAGEAQKRSQVEVYLPSILGYEKVARTAAEALAVDMGFAPDRIEDLKTALTEACLNAIEHGNLGDQTTRITVQLVAAAQQLEINVIDQGLKPITEQRLPPGSGPGKRGWGLFFIDQLMDEVAIGRLPAGGNQVRMVIYLEPG